MGEAPDTFEARLMRRMPMDEPEPKKLKIEDVITPTELARINTGLRNLGIEPLTFTLSVQRNDTSKEKRDEHPSTENNR
jgi:hypothetical protein